MTLLRSTHQVRAEINTEDGDGSEGQRGAGHHKEEEGRQLCHLGRQSVEDGLLEVVEDDAPLFYAPDDGGEVVVYKNQVGRFLGDLRARDTHGNPCR